MPIQALNSLRVSFDFADPCYVLKLASNAHAQAAPLVAAALSDRTVKLYQQAEAELRHLSDLRGHSGAVADVSLPSAAPLVLTSSADGSVRCWDARSGACSERCACGTLRAARGVCGPP